MNIKIISLAALIATQTACVGHRKTAKLESAAPALVAPLASLSIEPLGCPVYGGDDRPDYDAQALGCLVKWMGDTEGARREWLLAKQLDPANADAQAGLDLLEKVR